MPAGDAPDVVAGGSFRDPCGYVFRHDGHLLRRVNRAGAASFDALIASGLYHALTSVGLLVPHDEVTGVPGHADAYRVLAPQPVPFVSYPFEWAFSQLKAAALATLRVQRLAVEHGLTLKDASAYNVQFVGAVPLLIDTLSFEPWIEGTPWVAYRQFCQHFLGPLALMSRTDARLGGLSRLFIDGPPLDLVSRLLPVRARLRPSLLVHLMLHARAQRRHGDRTLAGADGASRIFTRQAMLGLVRHLEEAVDALTCQVADSPWSGYYDHSTYSDAAMQDKREGVARMLGAVQPTSVWDLGANTGVFSRLASAAGAYTVAIDADHAVVEQAAVAAQQAQDRRLLPLVMDLANPTGGLGWAHEERQSLVQRGPADLVLALGLLHHLTLRNQVPFARSAAFFGQIARALVIEFIPAFDPQVIGLASRLPSTVIESFTVEAFECAFRPCFDLVETQPLAGSGRRLYRMHRRA